MGFGMSSEKEYLLQGKYNRALNKIAQLEEKLAKVSAMNIEEDQNRSISEFERRDSEFLQEQVFLLQEKLKKVSEERDSALERLNNKEPQDIFAGSNNNIKKLENESIEKLIKKIDDNVSSLRKDLHRAQDKNRI